MFSNQRWKLKFRHRFVSNSSSSSFIITDRSLKTTAEVAWVMLNMVVENRIGWKCSSVCDPVMKGALEFLFSDLDFDEPITFPWSINEETYIWKNSVGQICVDTCNNHSWCDEIRYADVGDDWKWDLHDPYAIAPNPMDRWHEVEYLNLDTMQRSLRNDWSAQERRKKDSQ